MANMDSVFSDSTNLVNRIKSELSKAKNYIYICVSWINVGIFMNELNQACDRGVEVKIMTDSSNEYANPNGLNKDISVKKLGFNSGNNHVLLHNKFALIDGEILILSSYNWSFTGIKNMEFLTIISLDRAECDGSFYDSLAKFERQFLMLLNMNNSVLMNQYDCISNKTLIIDLKNDSKCYLIDYDDLEQYYTSGDNSKLEKLSFVSDPTTYFSTYYDDEGRKQYSFMNLVYTDIFAIYEWYDYIGVEKNGGGAEGFKRVYVNLFYDFKAPQTLMLPPY